LWRQFICVNMACIVSPKFWRTSSLCLYVSMYVCKMTGHYTSLRIRFNNLYPPLNPSTLADRTRPLLYCLFVLTQWTHHSTLITISTNKSVNYCDSRDTVFELTFREVLTSLHQPLFVTRTQYSGSCKLICLFIHSCRTVNFQWKHQLNSLKHFALQSFYCAV